MWKKNKEKKEMRNRRCSKWERGRWRGQYMEEKKGQEDS